MKRNNPKIYPNDSNLADKFRILFSLWITQFIFHKTEEYVYLRIPKEFIDRL